MVGVLKLNEKWVKDISEELISESELHPDMLKAIEWMRILFQDTGLWIIISDLKWRYLAVSPEIVKFLWISEEQFKWKLPSDISNSLQSDIIIRQLNDVVDWKTPYNIEINVKLKETWRELTLSKIASAIRDINWDIIWILSIYTDITEVRKLEREKAEANNKLLDLRKFLEQQRIIQWWKWIVKEVSLKYKSILIIVHEYIRLLKEKLKIEENIDLVDWISHACDRAETFTYLLEELSEDVEYETTSIDLYNIIKDLFTTIEFALPENINLKTNIRNNRFIVNWHEKSLSKAILEIIKNAIESLKIKSTEDMWYVNISAKDYRVNEWDTLVWLEKWEYVKLTIEDNWLGIQERDLENVLYPFFSTKLKKSSDVTWLWLTRAYKIVSELWGYIEIESKEWVWTNVHIYLKKSLSNSNSSSNAIKAVWNGQKILIIEEDEYKIRFLKTALEVNNFKVIVATSKEEWLKLCWEDSSIQAAMFNPEKFEDSTINDIKVTNNDIKIIVFAWNYKDGEKHISSGADWYVSDKMIMPLVNKIVEVLIIED